MSLFILRNCLILIVLQMSGKVFVISAITALEKQQYLDAHNYARRQLAMGLVGEGNRSQPAGADINYLQWSDELADKAEQDVAKCVYGHTQVKLLDLWPHVGQNIDRNPNVGPGIFVNEYFKESFYYRVMNNRTTDIYDISTYPTGHYTQVVWNETQYVGCAHTFCQNLSSYISFCNYGLAGNLVGALPYTAGAACTRCKPDAPFCLDGLCASQATCNLLGKKCTCNVTCTNGGVLDMTTCTCKQCPTGWETYFCDRPCINNYGWCSYNTPTTNNCTANWSYCRKLCNTCTYRPPSLKISNRDNILSTNYTVNQFPIGSTFGF